MSTEKYGVGRNMTVNSVKYFRNITGGEHVENPGIAGKQNIRLESSWKLCHWRKGAGEGSEARAQKCQPMEAL